MTLERGASLLGLLLLVVCLWKLDGMDKKMDERAPEFYGQTLNSGGVSTERWVLSSGEPEIATEHVARHMEAVRALAAEEGK